MSLSPQAFKTLYATYGPAVRARCRAICGNDVDADEALQETFLRAWRHRRSFDGRHPLAWLQTIARNTSLDTLRKRRPWESDPAIWLKLSAPDVGEMGATMDASRLLQSMGAEDAAILRLRHAQGWRIHEIAEHFDISARTVRRRLERLESRARALFKVPGEVCHGT